MRRLWNFQIFFSKICILTTLIDFVNYFQNTRSKVGEERHLDKEKEVRKILYPFIFASLFKIETLEQNLNTAFTTFTAWISISSVCKNSILSTFLDNVDYIQQRKSEIL